MSASVKASFFGMFPPMIKGERAMHHKVINVYCSFWVKSVQLSRVCQARTLPSGSMSASGQ